MTKFVFLASLFSMAVSFWLLLGTSRLLGGRENWLRFTMASVLVGLHTGLSLRFGWDFPGNAWVHLLVIGLSGLLSFGTGRNGVNMVLLYAMLLCSLEWTAAGSGMAGFCWLLVVTALMGCIYRKSWQQAVNHGRYIPVEVYHRGQVFRFTALRDTGNLLSDPITGEPVLILGGSSARALSGLSDRQLADPLGTILEHPISGLRLIPYRSLGNPGGFLLGLRFRQVRIGDETGPAVIALAAETLGRERVFQALVGGAA